MCSSDLLVVAMSGDLVPLLDGAARGDLDRREMVSCEGSAVCVVLASEGYPREFETGLPIEGLDPTGALPDAADTVVFHAGTVRAGDGFATAGGRVLGVTARGATVREARERAYAAASRIRFANLHMRRDIAARAVIVP